ncbi:MAG: DUF131 domain-containing protein [Archaeoglobales archaeon]|nr:DUF131 domain-containing protein [Archaeoglobales archaeon]
MDLRKVMLGLSLLMLGFGLLVASSGEVSYGGIFIIGPVPILFSSDASLVPFLVLFAVFAVLFMLFATRW